ncbi:MAG: lysophospholipid acyltransferase family protein [Gammaproteobacteria bacterium]|nr:lysophospholipid acyltransferase family protein [Gammaproteobacteria bacterium]MCP5136452.1 lysophospholipid acyltransferase family protein [Gammaproteobacteria bacterium]
MRARLLLVLLRLVARLPLRVVHGLGASFGWLLYVTPNNLRRVAETNLQLAFPDIADVARRQLLRATLIESGKTAMEIGVMWFRPLDRVRGLVKEIRGEAHFRELEARGKGVIALTPHLGQWELMGLITPEYMPMTSLYRPMRMAELEGPITAARERAGNRLQPTTVQGVKEVYAALRRGEMVGILPDQDPKDEGGAFVPFFGVDAYTMTFVCRLAIRSGVGVLVGYAERLPKGKGYRLIAHAVDPAINEGPLENSLKVMNQAVEACIREAPAQYQWIYKRWKRRPDGAPKIY